MTENTCINYQQLKSISSKNAYVVQRYYFNISY